MEKYTFSKEICYSKRLKTKMLAKYALTCSLSVIMSTGLVLGVVFGISNRNNYNGQGGGDMKRIFNLDPEEFSKLTETDEIYEKEDARIIAESESNSEPLTADSDSVYLTESSENRLDEIAKMEEIPEEDNLYYRVYRLKQGENASIVASKFDVTTDTILSVNGVANATRMATGAYLKVPSMSGIVYEVSKNGETLESIVNNENKTKKIDLDLYKIASINGMTITKKLSIGDTIFLAGGKLSNEQRAEISGDSYKKPLRNSYYISSPYGWRVSPFDSSKRSYHNGIDLACPKGTPIYATNAGTVITAGYSNVYGNYVIIKHTSGYKTLYGHMTVIDVRNGQYVDQGTIIGKVGSTGQSTGPHLHFTIYKNEKAINPYEKIYF